MSFNYRDIHSQLSVTNQPQPNINLGSLDFKKSIPIDEKSLVTSLENSHHHLCELEDGQISFSKHRTSNNIRLKRFLLSAIFSLVVLGGLLALSCVEWHGLPLWEVRGADLMGRALHADTGNLTGTPIEKIKNFISHTYLILIIIGIPVVLLIAILVTGCCSSGAFFNPLCLPCYLWNILFCCRGLDCIENICECCLFGKRNAEGRRIRKSRGNQESPNMAMPADRYDTPTDNYYQNEKR